MEDAAVEWTVWPGLTAYAAAVAAMESRARRIREGTAAEAVWLLTHPPLYTGGTSARPADLVRADFPSFASGRGGQWTYHGPGQRVGYVMLDLARPRGLLRVRDVRSFVWCLEEWLIRAVAAFGIGAERRAGRVGIWVPGNPDAKIAAIGVRVTRWVSLHGVALNVAPDLSHYDGIVPCGVADAGVTSLEALGVRPAAEAVDTALRDAWDGVFGAGRPAVQAAPAASAAQADPALQAAWDSGSGQAGCGSAMNPGLAMK